LSTARAAQPKPTKPQNTFEMGKQHLNALAAATRLLESLGIGQWRERRRGLLIQIARYISHRRAGTTPHLERARIAVGLGGTIAKCIAVVHGSSCVQQLIDVKFGIIVDVEASRAIRQAEVGAAKTMIERTEQRFDIKPAYLAADTAYGSAETLNWLVNAKKIEPHIPVIDKSRREDGTFSRADFVFDKERDVYVCPNNKLLHTTGTVHDGYALRYRAAKADCDVCAFKKRCCPSTPMRYVPRDLHEDARDVARALAKTEAFEQSRRSRKRVEMLFAHLKRILRLGRLRLRGPRGAQDEFTLAAIAQNLRRLAKLVARPPPAASACLA
jgi:Transposase DDE domain